MKKKDNNEFETRLQLLEVSETGDLQTSLSRLTLEQLLDLVEIIIEFEDVEQKYGDPHLNDAKPKYFH